MEVENSDSEMESKLNLTDLRFYMLLTPTVAIGFSFFGGQIRTLELSFFLTLISDTLAQKIKRSGRAINSSSALNF